MDSAKTTKKIAPLEEPQEHSVTVKLGKSHFDALTEWSKERFGLGNQAGYVRLLIDQEWKRRLQEKVDADLASLESKDGEKL